MKNLKFVLFCIALFIVTTSDCQNISMEFCAGIGTSQPTFKWAGAFRDKNAGNGSTENGQLISIGLTGKVYKFLYLKTEIGTNQTLHLLNFEYDASSTPTSTGGKAFGWQRSDFFYFAFLPEVRFEAVSHLNLFANIGAAFYSNTSSTFYDVTKSREIGEDFRDKSLAFVTNVGVDVKFNDNLGFIFNIGYVSMAAVSRNLEFIPRIGFTQFNFKGGISYTLR